MPGIAFTGPYGISRRALQAEVVMMLDRRRLLRVALATTHLPLTDVPRAIKRKQDS